MRLFLHSGGVFREAQSEVADFLGATKRILFVPYALHDLDAYVAKVREIVEPWGYEIDSTHETEDPRAAVRMADAVFVGGGNTFRQPYESTSFDISFEKYFGPGTAIVVASITSLLFLKSAAG